MLNLQWIQRAAAVHVDHSNLTISLGCPERDYVSLMELFAQGTHAHAATSASVAKHRLSALKNAEYRFLGVARLPTVRTRTRNALNLQLESSASRPNRRRDWREQVQFRRYAPTRSYKICHESFIDVQISFIFSEVAHGMAFIKHAPYFGPQSEGVRQSLKYDVAIGGPVSVPTQSRQTKRMRGVVGEIKSAFQ
jgi:hypothetical protein